MDVHRSVHWGVHLSVQQVLFREIDIVTRFCYHLFQTEQNKETKTHQLINFQDLVVFGHVRNYARCESGDQVKHFYTRGC